MAFWNKAQAMSDAIANAEAEAMYRNALQSSSPSLTGGTTTSSVYPTATSIGELARRMTVPGYSAYPPTDIEDPRHRKDMLAMRLRIKEGDLWGFDHIETALGKEKVFVFVLQDDKPAVLEDDAALFPSDTLITQLRLIQK